MRPFFITGSTILILSIASVSSGKGHLFEDATFLGWDEEKGIWGYIHHYFICMGGEDCRIERASGAISILVIGGRGKVRRFRWDSYKDIEPVDSRLKSIWNGADPREEGEKVFKEANFYFHQEGLDYFHPSYGSSTIYFKGEHLFQSEYMREEKVVVLKESDRWKGKKAEPLVSELFLIRGKKERSLLRIESRGKDGIPIEYRFRFYYSLKGNRIFIIIRKFTPAERPERCAVNVREFKGDI